MSGALEGVKIVDLSNWIAGPFGTMLLGDLGADIIKVVGQFYSIFLGG